MELPKPEPEEERRATFEDEEKSKVCCSVVGRYVSYGLT